MIGRSIEPLRASRIASCQAYPCRPDAGSAAAPDQNASRPPSGDQASEVPGSPRSPPAIGRSPPMTTTPPSGGATAIEPFRNGVGWRSREPTRTAATPVAATRQTTAAARRAPPTPRTKGALGGLAAMPQLPVASAVAASARPRPRRRRRRSRRVPTTAGRRRASRRSSSGQGQHGRHRSSTSRARSSARRALWSRHITVPRRGSRARRRCSATDRPST